VPMFRNAVPVPAAADAYADHSGQWSVVSGQWAVVSGQ